MLAGRKVGSPLKRGTDGQNQYLLPRYKETAVDALPRPLVRAVDPQRNPIQTVIVFMKSKKGRPISGDLRGYRLERKCFSKSVRCSATKLNIATQVYMEYMYTIRVLPKIVLVAKTQGDSSESLDIEPSHDQRIYPNTWL